MLQINVTNMASDALEDAMRLAQVKAMNSFTFSDCLNYLNYTWSDIYNRMSSIDDGYYGINVRLEKKLTKLPAFVKNTIQVYHAQSPIDHRRDVYREAGPSDLTASGVYKISGNDLYCADAERTVVWLYYVPVCQQIFFTHHNRDPKIYEDSVETQRSNIYNLFMLYGTYTDDDNNVVEVDVTTAARDELQKVTAWYMLHRSSLHIEDITEKLRVTMNDAEDGNWHICYISCDYPYIFVTYEHDITKEHLSGFFTRTMEFVKYNPFDFTGRNSDVEYVRCHWNDKTGLGVVVLDYNDLDANNKPKYKELGWTPDTALVYPKPEMYRYLVARLADKFSALNESNVLGVQKELIEARYAFEAFFDKDKSAWKRIANVTPFNYGDML